MDSQCLLVKPWPYLNKTSLQELCGRQKKVLLRTDKETLDLGFIAEVQ